MAVFRHCHVPDGATRSEPDGPDAAFVRPRRDTDAEPAVPLGVFGALYFPADSVNTYFYFLGNLTVVLGLRRGRRRVERFDG